MSNKRIGYFDFLRGIAIIMVVGIHTCNKCGLGNIYEVTSLAIREFINCAVPLFIALSAYFMTRKMNLVITDKNVLIKHQIIKVYVPMLVWSLPYLIMGLSIGKSPLKQLTLFFTGGYSIYYFIALIIQFYLLSLVFHKITIKRLIGGGIISFVYVIIMAYCGGNSLPMLAGLGFFPLWIVYWFLGMWLSENKRIYRIDVLLLLGIIGLLAQISESWLLKEKGLSNPFDATKPSSFIYSVVILMLLFSTKIEALYRSNVFTKSVEYIGKVSFGIYLIHCHLISFIPSGFWCVKWCIALLLSVAIAAGIHYIIPSKVRYYLGF